jgi:hypothetical protein
MSDELRVDIPVERERESTCYLSITHTSVDLHFNPKLPEGEHKPTRVELMAAAALLGISRVLSGKGETEILNAMRKVAKGGRR